MILKEAGSHAFPLLVSRMGFEKVDETATDSAEGGRSTATWKVDDNLRIIFTKDGLSDCEYVQIFGDEPESVGDTAEAISEIGTYGYDELLQAYRSADRIEEKSLHLIRVGVGAPPTADEEFCDCIIEALTSHQPKMREAGLWAASFYAMRRFFPFVQDIALTEIDEEIKETAELVAATYRQRGLE